MKTDLTAKDIIESELVIARSQNGEKFKELKLTAEGFNLISSEGNTFFSSDPGWCCYETVAEYYNEIDIA